MINISKFRHFHEKKYLFYFVFCFSQAAAVQKPPLPNNPATHRTCALGRALYFDENLSSPTGQSCASCHLPSAAFADPDTNQPTSESVIAGRFGSRNSPTVRYAAFIPNFRFIADGGAGNFLGGQFWDGRAASLEEQAKGPFLNPLEMNNPDKSTVVSAVSAANYAGDFLAIFGANAFNNIDTAYDPLPHLKDQLKYHHLIKNLMLYR